MILGLLGFFTYITMEVSLLTTLIETTIPIGVTFNQFGVAQRGFKYVFKFQKLSVTFRVCALNGLWGGAFSIMTNTWGSCSPIVREDFIFSSFEKCVIYLWKSAYESIYRNRKGITPEFLRFKLAMDKWLVSSLEEKFNAFNEEDFYGT